MNCSEAKESIQSYLDNELDECGTLSVQQHLESCASCSRLLDSFAKQDLLLREGARAWEVDSSRVRDKIIRAIRLQTDRKGTRWLAPAVWKSAAAAAIVTAAALLLLRGLRPDGISGDVYARAATDHADQCSIESGSRAITDPDRLNQLSGRYGRLKSTPDLSAFGYSHPRGTICRIGDTEFLHLIFSHPKEPPLSLFLRPHSPGSVPDNFMLVRRSQYDVASLSRSGVEFLVVTALDETRTSEILQAVASRL